MSSELPESTKQAVEQLAGPRYRPAAYPLLQLAKAAVHGHAQIAERVHEWQQLVDAERAERARLRAAESHAEPPPEPGGR